MAAPPNQTCDTAIEIESLPFDVIVDTTEAGDSSAPDTDCGSGDSFNAVFYKWTCPPDVGGIKISLGLGSGTNPTIVEVVLANPSAFRLWVANTDFSWEAPGGNNDVVVYTTDGANHVFVADLTGGEETGSSTPDWATCVAGGLGNTIIDNDIEWVYIGIVGGGGFGVPVTWTPETDPAPQFIYPTVPNGHIYGRYSYGGGEETGSDEPEWPIDGDYVSDGDGYYQDLGLYSAIPPDTYIVLTMFFGSCIGLTTWICTYVSADDTLEEEEYFVSPGFTYYFMLTSYDPGGFENLQFTLEELEDPNFGFCAILQPPAVGSGIYRLERNKRNDTIYTSTEDPENPTTEDVAIPHQFAQLGLIGDK